VRIAYAPNLPETAEYLPKMVGTTTVLDKKISISGRAKGGKSRSTSISETSRPILTPDECMRLPGLSKETADNAVPGDMLIFTMAIHRTTVGRFYFFWTRCFPLGPKSKSPAWLTVIPVACPIPFISPGRSLTARARKLFRPRWPKRQ
jgi:type IV secretion system protein VirD4